MILSQSGNDKAKQAKATFKTKGEIMLVIIEKSGTNVKSIWVAADEEGFIASMDAECQDRTIENYEDAFEAIDADQPVVIDLDDAQERQEYVNKYIKITKDYLLQLDEGEYGSISDFETYVNKSSYSSYHMNSIPYEALLELDELEELIEQHNLKAAQV